MSEMVERVAELLSMKESGLSLAELANHSQPRDADFFRESARAVIKAMREPTRAVADAGIPDGNYWDDLTPEIVWQAMIDAILGANPRVSVANPPPPLAKSAET